MKIKFFGSGCINCDKVYEELLKALKNIDKDYELEYISDIKTMIEYGIMMQPAIMIDEKIISQGENLKAEDIEKLIK